MLVFLRAFQLDNWVKWDRITCLGTSSDKKLVAPASSEIPVTNECCLEKVFRQTIHSLSFLLHMHNLDHSIDNLFPNDRISDINVLCTTSANRIIRQLHGTIFVLESSHRTCCKTRLHESKDLPQNEHLPGKLRQSNVFLLCTAQLNTVLCCTEPKDHSTNKLNCPPLEPNACLACSPQSCNPQAQLAYSIRGVLLISYPFLAGGALEILNSLLSGSSVCSDHGLGQRLRGRRLRYPVLWR